MLVQCIWLDFCSHDKYNYKYLNVRAAYLMDNNIESIFPKWCLNLRHNFLEYSGKQATSG